MFVVIGVSVFDNLNFLYPLIEVEIRHQIYLDKFETEIRYQKSIFYIAQMSPIKSAYPNAPISQI